MSNLRFEVIETRNNILQDYRDCKTFTIKTIDNIDLSYLIEAIFCTLIHNNKRSKDISIIGYTLEGKNKLIKSFSKPALLLDSQFAKIEVYIKDNTNIIINEKDEKIKKDLKQFDEFICQNIFI